ncbi:hypothetical protein MRX96_003886 [Rhipicephalus microplus]
MPLFAAARSTRDSMGQPEISSSSFRPFSRRSSRPLDAFQIDAQDAFLQASGNEITATDSPHPHQPIDAGRAIGCEMWWWSATTVIHYVLPTFTAKPPT